MATKLSDLEATFIRVRMDPAPDCIGRTLPDGSTQWGGFLSPSIWSVPHRLGAHGVQFLCPTCFVRNGGDVGTHMVQVFFACEDIPGDLGKNLRGQEVRWSVEGQTLDELSLGESISIRGPCESHFWVTGGEVRNA